MLRDVFGVREKLNPKMQDMTRPQIESFNFAMQDGLQLAVQDLLKEEFQVAKGGPAVKLWYEDFQIAKPSRDNLDEKLYPNECREGGFTYNGLCVATIGYKVGEKVGRLQRTMGKIPLMVKSNKCHLDGMSPAELVKAREEGTELGGYFIINGLEKLIRLICMPKRNFPMAVQRPSWAGKGNYYTQHGVQIRSVRKDQSNQNMTLHYLSNGSCSLRISVFKQEYFIPGILILKALISTTDREIYNSLVRGDVENTFLTDRVEVILREAKSYENMETKEQCLAYLGSSFRIALRVPERMTDIEVGQFLLDRYIFVHLSPQKNKQKFDMLAFMIRKLYSLASGEIGPDNADSPMNFELLLPGHVYLMFLKEKMQEWLVGVKLILNKLHAMPSAKAGLTWESDPEGYLRKAMEKNFDLGKKVDYFLATGNLISSTGMGLMQLNGYVVVAEKLNWLRYFSHFRCVHRGAFFATMKTTAVRKLMPESWGFFCPVHTPDGAPCGLINHLTAVCRLITHQADTRRMASLLVSLGVSPASQSILFPSDQYLDVFLDGELMGFIPHAAAPQLVEKLRYLKVKKLEDIPWTLELGLVPAGVSKQYPGLYMWTTPSRMMRPVKYLATGDIEYIGSFEQVYMNIAVLDEDRKDKDIFTHQEIRPMNMLSVVAGLTPFCDMNQSPRNMYQCQMAKQSIATPCHSFQHRTDNKIYRIQNPQAPVSRTNVYDEYELDDYPIGANAIVAVLSYTGYDMEDAMIINKAAYQRGFGHASVYKNELVDFARKEKKGDAPKYIANPLVEDKDHQAMDEDGMQPAKKRFCEELEEDGLPAPGTRLEAGSPFYVTVDGGTGKPHLHRYKSKEEAVVDEVRVVGTSSKGLIQRVSIKLRLNRNPVIGDKFASRHGQKGVMSQLWPQENMPFSESGMSPDVIINPHAFPSRMTIAMLIESMASKSGALHGMFQDATPFRFDEKHTAVDYFGQQLLAAGYNYYGNEPMYSGILGCELRADIYLGVVYYQRLRHMVKDKYQVRSTGPVHQLTQQPIKGRQKGGGIRFGEMERDCLLAHGTSFLLQDRLFKCSDYSRSWACKGCGSIISPVNTKDRKVMCTFCESKDGVTAITIPYVFRYLVNELAAMNIRITMNIQ